MTRKIKPGTSSTQSLTVNPPTDDLRAWLTTQAITYKLNCLLVHCDDGVIWGELRDNILALSCDQAAFPKAGLDLRWETLQQARLFGEMGEMLIYPGSQGWQAKIRRDDIGTLVEYIDDPYLLWGNRQMPGTMLQHGFLQIAEGSQGIIHAPPIHKAPTDRERARLCVRHYLGADEAGMVRIVASRLMKLVGPGEGDCASKEGDAEL
jgi:CRISPR-associated protein (TIGR03984 family)